MRLLHIIVYTIVVLLLLGGCASLIRANTADAQASSTSTSSERIQEDDPRWNCKTMGNGVCGPNVQNDPRFIEYDQAFNCFAEIAYTEPKVSWNEQVMRCIPPVHSN